MDDRQRTKEAKVFFLKWKIVTSERDNKGPEWKGTSPCACAFVYVYALFSRRVKNLSRMVASNV